ncbi:hypothetical protein ACWEIJ_38710 [Lentzea sp. NPDC004789]
MSLVESVRAALDGYRYVSETSALGGVVFEWDGDPLVGVVDDELVVRVPGGGWETVHHEPDRGRLQRMLLDHTRHPVLRQLAVTCLGHVGRLEGEVLAEVVPRLQELPEDALQDIESYRGSG